MQCEINGKIFHGIQSISFAKITLPNTTLLPSKRLGGMFEKFNDQHKTTADKIAENHSGNNQVFTKYSSKVLHQLLDTISSVWSCAQSGYNFKIIR